MKQEGQCFIFEFLALIARRRTLERADRESGGVRRQSREKISKSFRNPRTYE